MEVEIYTVSLIKFKKQVVVVYNSIICLGSKIGSPVVVTIIKLFYSINFVANI